MFPHPWVVKTIKESVFSPLPNTRVNLFVFGSSIIAGGWYNYTEPIFWFSTSTMFQSDCPRAMRFIAPLTLSQMMWGETQNNDPLCSKAKSGESFPPSCRIIVIVCGCVWDWTLHMQWDILTTEVCTTGRSCCLLSRHSLLLLPSSQLFPPYLPYFIQAYLFVYYDWLLKHTPAKFNCLEGWSTHKIGAASACRFL